MRGKRHYAAALSPRAPPGNDGDKGPSLLSFAFDTSNTVGQTMNPTADKYSSESAVSRTTDTQCEGLNQRDLKIWTNVADKIKTDSKRISL